MAGAKKKKKPAANPARGFATTSIASKPRPEAESEPDTKPLTSGAKSNFDTPPSNADKSNAPPSNDNGQQQGRENPLSAEEFERQLEESELQLLVEKYAPRAKRDAQRQRARLETDRRLLRNQADTINIPKWLPPDLLDHILDLINAETRFSSSNVSSESTGSGKMPPEEDTIVRLWTLRQTLEAAAFPDARVEAVLQHILDIAPNVQTAAKDSIWGLDEALDWLARESSTNELPPYEHRGKVVAKDVQNASPFPSRTQTPKPESQQDRKGKESSKSGTNERSGKGTSRKLAVTCDIDIEPEDLVPEYLAAKTSLLELSRSESEQDAAGEHDVELAIAKLEAKLEKIKSDVLFDKFAAELKWKSERIILEKRLAVTRKDLLAASAGVPKPAGIAAEAEAVIDDSDDDEVAGEAERMAAEVLAEASDEDDIAGLFASLPQSEVDPNTGKSQTVLASADGVKLILRDFGKWTGVSPRRVLEEACRSRDSSVKVNYTVVSETSFANRQSIDIWWTKAQEPPRAVPGSDVEVIADQTRFTFTMLGVAVPDKKQAEAYIATSALFHVFSGNAREEKVNLRLPSAWKDLWNEMAEARKEQLDSQDRDAVRSLRTLVRQRQDRELEDGVILQGAFRGRAAKAPQNSAENANDRKKQICVAADDMRRIWADKSGTRKFQAMLGRSCKIYCTEPRRISAISLARRVSEELGENKGDVGSSRSLVGYSIRLEANTSRETRLVYATTGIVMRMLEGSNDLREVTHLILDEVHERTIDSDFLLIVLKRLLTKRKDLKVLLMSATVDAERFSRYLGGAPILNVPGRTFPVDVRYLEDAVEITGYNPTNSPADKMVDLDEDGAEDDGSGNKSEFAASLTGYSAKTRSILSQMDEYHIDFDLIVQLMAQIASSESLEPYSRAVLVFLPGIAEIRALNDLLLGDPRFARDWLVYPLHSSIATEDQESAFLVPPPGIRKIVLATNIAETGITIPDVTCVIDTGKHREMRYDERRQLSRLIDTFISRANAKQRRGRAGRVQNGICFHMFTKHRHDNIMSDQQTPEMLRLSLQDLAIRVKICKIGGIEETLSDALDPPSAKNIRRAVDALVDVRALAAGEELTPLGHQLARLPLDVFLGKLILLGTVFKCLDMAITVAAILSSKSPFSAPFGQRAQADNARMLFRRGDSDLLTIYNAYVSWKRVCQSNSGSGKEFQFCRKNFLSQPTLANIEDLKGQLLVSLVDAGFLSLTEEERRTLKNQRFTQGGRGRRQQTFFEVPHRVNVNSDNDVVSSSVIAWSFYPKMLVRDTPGTKGLRNIGNNQSISLHPSSVNRNYRDIKWLSYYHIMQSKSVYHAHETTAVEPFAIALLCGEMFSGVIVLDGNRGRFALPDWKSMLVVKVLRTRLRDLLARSFRLPGKLPTAQHQKWLDVWQRLFAQDSLLQGQDSIVKGSSLTVGKA
ncbi:hypothetical protein RJ55_01633 [Drechmeria coniospora]|nr:hypothetical protein RJ55_01633 [Drechmeria coniospora]